MRNGGLAYRKTRMSFAVEQKNSYTLFGEDRSDHRARHPASQDGNIEVMTGILKDHE